MCLYRKHCHIDIASCLQHRTTRGWIGMKLSQGAYCNLSNRYRAVLKKCHLLNTFGSLAVAAMLVMGGASAAQAAPEEMGLGNGGNVPVSSLADTEAENTTGGADSKTSTVNTSGIAQVTDDENEIGISGTSKSVLLKGAAIELNATGTLVLTGDATGAPLIQTSTQTAEQDYVGDLRIGGPETSKESTDVTLGTIDANHKGTLGDIVMDAGTGPETHATLNVLGAGSAEFTVGAIQAAKNTNHAISVQGAVLNTGNISVVSDDATYEALDTLTITEGSVNVIGAATIAQVTLSNGSLLAKKDGETGGNITITEVLRGSGTVSAETLHLNSVEDVSPSNALILSGTDINITGTVTSNGIVHLLADTLTTQGMVSLTANDQNTVVVKQWAPKQKVVASESNLQVGQFGTSTDGTSTLDTTVALTGSSPLLAHGDVSLAQALEFAEFASTRGATYYTTKTLNLDKKGQFSVGIAEPSETVEFAGSSELSTASLLIVDSSVMNGQNVFTYSGTSTTEVTAAVAENATMYVPNARNEDQFTVFGEGFGSKPHNAGWANPENVMTDTDMLTATYAESTSIVTISVNDAREVYPDLSDDMADAVTDFYTDRLNDVDADDQGTQFISRATNNRYLGKDKAAVATTIESAARIAFAGAVPQMTKMASDAATNAVVNRMGFANPENGAKAMNVDGQLVDEKALGLALWIAPLWSNQTGFGMEAGNLDYGYNANLGGVSLGADYTWANNFRAGLMFNIGGGYAQSSGDFSDTTNSMTFWGIGAYAGWKYENFALMGDVSYTSTWNSVEQELDQRMKMGDLEADIQASAISAGLRGEYKFETSVLDIIPHVGVRYMSINTWGYDVDNNVGTVLENDGFQQSIWTFPVGVTFSREVEMNSDWYFKPSVDFTVIPAAGDIKAREDVCFTGLNRSIELETQMMDYFIWQGGVGLEFGNENMSVGVNYTLQAGQNSTGHGVFGVFRYEF